MSSFFDELKRRNVFKSAVAYLVASWLILQVFALVLPNIGAPDWVLQTLMLVLGIGFIIWLFVSWIYEVTPDGLKKTSEVEEDFSITAKTNKRLNVFILIALIGVIGVMIFKPNSKLIKFDDGKYVIAVLPFENMSPNDKNEWLGDGVTEDLIHNLGKIQEFRTINRTSVMKFKDMNITILEISKMLGTAYIVEGSVRVEGVEVLISVQLLDHQGHQIWADRFRDKPDNILDLQAMVAEKVSEIVLGKLSNTQKDALKGDRKINPEAIRNLTLGNQLYDRMATRYWKAAKTYYERAVEIEPEWEQALATLAFLEVYYNSKKGDSLADKALSINPKLDQAWVAKAIVSVKNNKFNEAESSLLKAIQTIQDAPWSHDYLASHYLFRKPDYEKALFHANESLKIDPLNLYFIRRQIFSMIFLERFREADSLINEKRIFIDEEVMAYIHRWKINKMAEFKSREARDYRKSIEVISKTLDTIPEDKGYYHWELASAYNRYFNDDQKYLQYAKAAWADRRFIINTDLPVKLDIALELVKALLKNEMINEARNFLDSEEVIKEFEDSQFNFQHKREAEWRYYLAMKNWTKAKEFVNDDVVFQTILDAHAGQKEKVIEGLSSKEFTDPTIRAQLFAILKEPDSVFYYLKQDKIDAPLINSLTDFDPYRKLLEFVAFREKYYLDDKSIY